MASGNVRWTTEAVLRLRMQPQMAGGPEWMPAGGGQAAARWSSAEYERLKPERNFGTGHLRLAAQNLRNTQLREGSRYSNVRTLVPVAVLGLVWLWVNQGEMMLNPRLLLNHSVGMRHLLLAVLIVTVWNVWLSLSQFTAESAKRDVAAELRRLTAAACVCGLVPLAENALRGLPRQGFLLAGLTTVGLLGASYALIGAFFAVAVVMPWVSRPRMALIVGSGQRAEKMKQRLLRHGSRLQIFGCVDDEYFGTDAATDGYFGPISGLPELLKTYPIELVLIGLPIKSKYDEIQHVIDICEATGVESHYMQDVFETTKTVVEMHEPHRYGVLPAVASDPKQYVKRGLDLVLGLLLVILFAPVMMLAALAIRLTSAGPILFVQQRYGCNRRRFPMFKFRSMMVDAEARQASLEAANEAAGPVFKLRRDPRVTKVGAFLRKTSIDELPQLFNVLRGEMSLVGPRPLPLRDVSRFEEAWLLRRFSVRPGLTCLWQIRGRSNMSFDSWVRLDLLYIDQWSLWLDFKILVITVPAVLRGSGAM